MSKSFTTVAAFLCAVASVFAQDQQTPPESAKAAQTPPEAEQILPPPPEPIHKEAIIDAPREEVYRAWTSAEALTEWFVPAAMVDFRFDGPYELYFLPDAPKGGRGGEGNRVLAYVENELIAFTWNAPPKFMPERGIRTFVVVRFDDAGEGETRVRLTHDGFGAGGNWPDVRAYFDAAWGAVLGILQKQFAEGTMRPEAERTVIAPNKQPKHYVYYIHPTRAALITDGPTPEEAPHLQGHVAHIQKLLAEGRLVIAGPSFAPAQYPTGDESVKFEMAPPGIVVFQADSDAEALEVMMRDPAVEHGVFKGVVYPLVLSFERF